MECRKCSEYIAGKIKAYSEKMQQLCFRCRNPYISKIDIMLMQRHDIKALEVQENGRARLGDI